MVIAGHSSAPKHLFRFQSASFAGRQGVSVRLSSRNDEVGIIYRLLVFMVDSSFHLQSGWKVLLQSLFTFLKQSAETIKHAWRDSRLPLMARVLLILAPLYWISPFDLRPDYLPGGYIDDLIIVPCLIVAGLWLIPRIVFIDARKAAVGAACGLICVSLTTTTVKGAAACELFDGGNRHPEVSVQAKKYCGLEDTSGRYLPSSILMRAQRCNTPTGAPVMTENVRSPGDFSNPLVDKDLGVGSGVIATMVKSLSCVRQAFVLAICPVSTLLVLRGGQSQLYSADADSAAYALIIFPYQFTLPLHFAGGIFFICSAQNIFV